MTKQFLLDLFYRQFWQQSIDITKSVYIQIKIDVDQYWFGGGGGEDRPAIVAPDPFELPPPNEFEEAEYHLPRAYIIGASRCGANALREYIRYHPQIYFANRSELHYWDRHYSFDLDWYKQQLPKTKNWQVAVDYTSDYFTEAGVPQRIDRIG